MYVASWFGRPSAALSLDALSFMAAFAVILFGWHRYIEHATRGLADGLVVYLVYVALCGATLAGLKVSSGCLAERTLSQRLEQARVRRIGRRNRTIREIRFIDPLRTSSRPRAGIQRAESHINADDLPDVLPSVTDALPKERRSM